MRLERPEDNTRSGASPSSPPLHAEVRAAVIQLLDDYRIENNGRGKGMLDVEPVTDAILQAVADALLAALPKQRKLTQDFGGYGTSMIATQKNMYHIEGFNEALDAVTRVIGELRGNLPDTRQDNEAR